ncbi:MAG: MBL fold metallo-hydrolase [Stappiaceae bacterium]
MSALVFDKEFDAAHGHCVRISNMVRRITAENSGPFTFKGTNTYLVGHQSVAIIDPGPEDSDHISHIISAVGDGAISHIVVTHTHMDHSPGARLLQERTGAPIIGADVHRPARPLQPNEVNPLDASSDSRHHPDSVLSDGEIVFGDDWTLETVSTPGHTANHLAFALKEESTLFSGDHVMGWSTSIVAPPDGSMTEYMASLEKLRSRAERRYLPGHGGVLDTPKPYLEGLIAHRRDRERSILEQLTAGVNEISAIVRILYRDTPEHLHAAAALSVLAHMEDLVNRGLVQTPDKVELGGTFQMAKTPGPL